MLGSIRFDQEAGVRGNQSQILYCGFLRKEEESKVNSLGLTSVNNSSESYSLESVPSCLISHPRLILGRGNIPFVCES